MIEINNRYCKQLIYFRLDSQITVSMDITNVVYFAIFTSQRNHQRMSKTASRSSGSGFFI